MPERAHTLSHAMAGTAVTIGGFATGLHYEVLLAGFVGALASLSYLPLLGIWSRVWTLVTSSLTAGYCGPYAALFAAWAAPGINDITTGVMVFSGFLVGLGGQILIPAALSWIKRKAEVL